MTKREFDRKKKNCPWFFRDNGEPRCSAQDARLNIKRHCAKKNCAFVYWEEVKQCKYQRGY